MGTVVGQIDRSLAARYGAEAVAAGEAGTYQSASGARVDVGSRVALAKRGTVTYPPGEDPPEVLARPFATDVAVANETTLSAGKRMLDAGLRPVVLNFASAVHPGGGFLTGARAQEEYLCRSSCLYECLRGNPMYDYHRDNWDPIFSDYVIYSPDVPVIRSDDGALMAEPYPVSVITSPAVKATRVPDDRRHEIEPAMWSRIPKVLAVGASHGHDVIVLGAWGCGAFGNDPNMVVGLFRRALNDEARGWYRHVVFAIVDWSPERRYIRPFEEAFER